MVDKTKKQNDTPPYSNSNNTSDGNYVPSKKKTSIKTPRNQTKHKSNSKTSDMEPNNKQVNGTKTTNNRTNGGVNIDDPISNVKGGNTPIKKQKARPKRNASNRPKQRVGQTPKDNTCNDSVKGNETLGVSGSLTTEKMTRPWGYYQILERYANDGKIVQVKILKVFAGKRTSLQSHRFRKEKWIVLEGQGQALVGGIEYNITKGSAPVKVDRLEKHRITAITDLTVLEVQEGVKVEENDVTRYEDDWNRTSEKIGKPSVIKKKPVDTTCGVYINFHTDDYHREVKLAECRTIEPDDEYEEIVVMRKRKSDGNWELAATSGTVDDIESLNKVVLEKDIKLW